MAYQEFAWFYDEFNAEADYEALFQYIYSQLTLHGVKDGILADLGCGTGDLTLMLAKAGYDVIGVDCSEDMLNVLREKAEENNLLGQILLLHQDILHLDLFGTIRAAVSTFDTFNHIGPEERFEKAIAKAAFFMEKGGVFLFDLNTPYKHSNVLADHTFEFEEEDASCQWENRYDAKTGRVDLSLSILDKTTEETFHEEFSEYSYPLEKVKALLQKYGFDLAAVVDGEDFGVVREDSQRWMFTAVKRYTQEEQE